MSKRICIEFVLEFLQQIKHTSLHIKDIKKFREEYEEIFQLKSGNMQGWVWDAEQTTRHISIFAIIRASIMLRKFCKYLFELSATTILNCSNKDFRYKELSLNQSNKSIRIEIQRTTHQPHDKHCAQNWLKMIVSTKSKNNLNIPYVRQI